MRTINLPDRETSREYLARVKAEKEAAATQARWLIKKEKRDALVHAAFAGGLMLFGLLLYAVFVPVKG